MKSHTWTAAGGETLNTVPCPCLVVGVGSGFGPASTSGHTVATDTVKGRGWHWTTSTYIHPYIHRYRFINGLAHMAIQMCFPQHTQAQMYVHINVSGCFGHACMQKHEKSFSMRQCVGKVYKCVPLQMREP